MKKILAALAALTTAALMAQDNSIMIQVPTNVPTALVQAEIFQSARAIALMQIQRANLNQLEAVNPALTNFDAGNVTAARQIMATTVRATTDVNKLNQIIAAMPAHAALTGPASQTATNTP